MYSEAYWLAPKTGKIYPVSITHIVFIQENPELFNITFEYIQSVFQKNNEKIGSEGISRAELMTEAFKKGWIRLRNNQKSGWVAELWMLDKKSKILLKNWFEQLNIKEIITVHQVKIYQENPKAYCSFEFSYEQFKI